MKRAVCSVLFVTGVAAVLLSQQTGADLDALMQNFDSAEPEAKVRLLTSLLDRDDVGQYGELFGRAVTYGETNAGRIDTSSTLDRIVELAVQGAARSGYRLALDDMWSIFTSIEDTQLRVQILEASAQLGAGDREAAAVLDRWVSNRHTAFQGGTELNPQVMAAAMRAMGTMRAERFFPALVEAITLQYADSVTDAARSALFALEGNVAELAAGELQRLEPQGMLQLLRLLVNAEELSSQEKAGLAGAALRRAVQIEARSTSVREDLRDVRSLALDVIVENRYSEATQAVIANFNTTVRQYDAGRVQKGVLLDAIEGLGAMGTEAAASRLTRYLDLLNTYTENDRPTDVQITLAVVENLEELGEAVAYNTLFYASLLDYPTRVESAIRAAMQTLSE